jgi:hypothetical protein
LATSSEAEQQSKRDPASSRAVATQEENAHMTTMSNASDCGTQAATVFGGRRSHGIRSHRIKSAAGAVAGLFVLAGLVAPVHAATTDPGVDFHAHIEHEGLVVDQAHNGTPAVLVPAGSLFSSGPNFLLQENGKTLAALWVKDPEHATVRRTADPASPVIGRVDTAWDDGAIRLTLKPTGGPVLQTSTFHRLDGPRSSDVLGSQATTVLDVRGIYLANLRDAQGKDAGWLRVRISPYQNSRRIYDGELPASVQEPLAAAAVALVNSDVSNLTNNAVDVYLGN